MDCIFIKFRKNNRILIFFCKNKGIKKLAFTFQKFLHLLYITMSAKKQTDE